MANRTHKRCTERGFRVYAEEEGVCVHESSIAFEGAHVWVDGGRPIHDDGKGGTVHLSVKQAVVVISALRKFVAEAKAGDLTEPAEVED